MMIRIKNLNKLFKCCNLNNNHYIYNNINLINYINSYNTNTNNNHLNIKRSYSTINKTALSPTTQFNNSNKSNNNSLNLEIEDISINNLFYKNKYPNEKPPSFKTPDLIKEKVRETFNGLLFNNNELLYKSLSPEIIITHDQQTLFISDYFNEGAKIFPLALSKYLYERFPNITPGVMWTFYSFFLSRVLISSVFQYLNLPDYIKVDKKISSYKYEKLYFVTFYSFVGALYQDQGENVIKDKVVPLFLEYLDTLNAQEFNQLYISHQLSLHKKRINNSNNEKSDNNNNTNRINSNNNSEKSDNSTNNNNNNNNSEDDSKILKSIQDIIRKSHKNTNQELYELYSVSTLGIPNNFKIPEWFSTIISRDLVDVSIYIKLQKFLSSHSKGPGQIQLVKEINKGTDKSLYIHAFYIEEGENNFNILGYGIGKTLLESRQNAYSESFIKTLYQKNKFK